MVTAVNAHSLQPFGSDILQTSTLKQEYYYCDFNCSLSYRSAEVKFVLLKVVLTLCGRVSLYQQQEQRILQVLDIRGGPLKCDKATRQIPN